MDIDKLEILKNIKNFLGAKNELAIKEAEHQIKIFELIFEKEIDNYEKSNHIDITNPREDLSNIEILKTIVEFRKKIKIDRNINKKIEQNNIEKKKNILIEFRCLIEKKEKLSDLVKGITVVRENWNRVGDISPKIDHQLQKEFSKLNESFNYNFNIYKELKENDLKRNFSLKNQIIHDLKNLKTLNDVKKIQIELKILQNKWEEIGPTFKEHWMEVKNNYWEAVNNIQKQIREHYQNIKITLNENLIAKKELVKKAEILSTEDIGNLKNQEIITKKFKALQEDWKKIGPVPKNVNEKIWLEFRSYADKFFSARKQNLEIEQKKIKENYHKKIVIIEKTKKYVDNIENDSNPILIKKLQEDWKKIGHAGKYVEQKLWKKFRTQCDAFFDAKNKHKKVLFEKEKRNLKAKNSIIAKIKEDKNLNFTNLKALIDEFQKIGQVPRKNSKNIVKSFENLINICCEKNNFTKEDIHKIKKAVKISFLSNSANPEKTFLEEKSRLNKLINNCIKETTQLENNLSFFSNVKGEILADFHRKINLNKEKINSLKDELKKLSEAYNQN